jgi:CRP/FNR family transcriptional regulator
MIEPEQLKKVFIFSELDKEDAEHLLGFCRLKTYNKGDIIFFDTEPYLGFYVVIQGMIKIYKFSIDGREHIVHLVDEYNTFAEVPLFEHSGKIRESNFRYPANAMAIEDETELLLIPAREFLDFINESPGLCLKMVSGFAKRLRHLNKHITDITLKDVSKRVCSYLLEQAKNCPPSEERPNTPLINLSISKNDLASYLGTISETLSRTFRKLQEEEIIEVSGKQIKILNISKLSNMSKL